MGLREEADEGLTWAELAALVVTLAALGLFWSWAWSAMLNRSSPSPVCRQPPAILGDCDGNADVSDIEANLCWGIESLSVPTSACPACDYDGDGVVSVQEAQWATWNARR